MRTAYRAASVIIAVIFLLVLARLAHYQNGVPPHHEQFLPDGTPATFYLPGISNELGPDNPFLKSFPEPVEQRPPAVVLIHGFSSDRVNSSALARRLAQNGYGVLAIDVRGHGENRNPFVESDNGNGLREDVKNAVEFMRQSNFVDGSRIIVIGHSMGAGATLDFAAHDAGIKGAVMISGGFRLDGPEHPRNTLFIYAENDPGFIRELAQQLAAHLAGQEKIELGKLYGDFAKGTAVEAIQVARVNHLTIVWSADAAQAIVRWLDSACGVKRDGAVNLSEPRLPLILISLLLFILALIPIARVCAGMTPIWERRTADGSAWLGLIAIVGALFAAMALNAAAPQASFLSILEGHAIVSWVAIAGALLLALLAIQHPEDLRQLADGLGSTLFASALAFGAIVVLSGAYDVALHRTALTPERLVVMLASAALMLPFFLSFELMLRHGTTPMATLIGSIGRVLIVVTMVIGLGLGTMPFVLGLLLPVFMALFVMFEVFAASVYSVSGNLLLIAIVETLWIARTSALIWPITFKF